MTFEDKLFESKTLEKINRIISINYKYLFCPSCYKKIVTVDDDTFAPKCKKCGWTGPIIYCLSEEEAINANRKTLIDEILE
jgi:translation initiation factor 2 beta subunit (eIF-2beta)/eIF-5